MARRKPNRNKQKPQRKTRPLKIKPPRHDAQWAFGWIDHSVLLDLQRCPVLRGVRWSGNLREPNASKVAETGAETGWKSGSTSGPCYQCPCLRMGRVTRTYPLGCREGFSYGGRLSRCGGLAWAMGATYRGQNSALCGPRASSVCRCLSRQFSQGASVVLCRPTTRL